MSDTDLRRRAREAETHLAKTLSDIGYSPLSADMLVVGLRNFVLAIASQAGEGTAPEDTQSTVAEVHGENRGGNAPAALSSQAPGSDADPTAHNRLSSRGPGSADKAGSRDDTPPALASDPVKVSGPGSALVWFDRYTVAEDRTLQGSAFGEWVRYDDLVRVAGSYAVKIASLDRAWHVGESAIEALKADLTAAQRERDEARELRKVADKIGAEKAEQYVAERKAHDATRAELTAVRGRMAEATRKAAAIRDATNEYAAPPTPWLVSAWMRDLAALLTDPAPERDAAACYECATPLAGPYCPRCDPRAPVDPAGEAAIKAVCEALDFVEKKLAHAMVFAKGDADWRNHADAARALLVRTLALARSAGLPGAVTEETKP